MKKLIKGLVSTALALSIAVGGLMLPNDREVSVTKAYGAATSSTVETIDPPVASLGSGKYTFFNDLIISLSSNDPKAIIFYSLNNTGYRLYSTPLVISHNTIIRSYAVNISSSKISSVSTYSYELTPHLTADKDSGTYNEVQRVHLTSNVNGVKIYYTLDGSTPNENSTLYTDSGVIINKNCTLNAVAVKAGCSRNILTRSYVIRNYIPDDELVAIDGGLITSATPADNTGKLNEYTSKWGYNQLNSTQKKVYEALFNAAKTHSDEADISSLKIKKSELDKIYWAFDYDNPQFFALANGYAYRYYPSTGIVTTINMKYSRTAVQESMLRSSFNSSAENALSAARVIPSDYEKLKYIHDWIVNKTDYTLNGPVYKSEADGPIVYGEALCEGYSKAFMYLAQSLGFDCICVVGTANGGSHMWNMVKLNGLWYHVDTTFDDPIMSNGSRTLTHNYFLKSTSEISKTHSIDNPIAVPVSSRSY